MKIIGEYFCFLFFGICRMIFRLYNDNLFILFILQIDVVLIWKTYFHFPFIKYYKLFLSR